MNELYELRPSGGANIRAVFFDVDDTLYDHLDPLREALVEVLGLPDDFPFGRAYYLFRYYSDLLSDEEGLSAVPDKAKLAVMHRERFIRALGDLGVKVDHKQAEQLQAVYYSKQFAIRPFDGAFSLINYLQEQGINVGLITNGAGPHQSAKLEALGVRELIPENLIFISGTMGVAKPDPQLFAEVGKATGIPAEQCVYVGDSWRNDVVGSLEAGWTCIWFNHRGVEPETAHRPHFTAKSYAEIRTILQETIHRG